jgi:hypothetical protein
VAADRSKWPLMVWLGLVGLPTRRSAWAFFWLSAALGAGFTAYGFLEPIFFLGSLMLVAALWYFLSIRWVDQYGSWS